MKVKETKQRKRYHRSPPVCTRFHSPRADTAVSQELAGHRLLGLSAELQNEGLVWGME